MCKKYVPSFQRHDRVPDNRHRDYPSTAILIIYMPISITLMDLTQHCAFSAYTPLSSKLRFVSGSATIIRPGSVGIPCRSPDFVVETENTRPTADSIVPLGFPHSISDIPTKTWWLHPSTPIHTFSVSNGSNGDGLTSGTL